MKRILFFSRDPGAANTIIPVYETMSLNEKYTCLLYGKEFALEKYEAAGLKGSDICNELQGELVVHYKNFIVSHHIDCIVTGTTSNDYSDRMLWHAASMLEIPTIAILDQWMNYKDRFTFSDEVQHVPTTVYPQYVCVMDEYAKTEMMNEGILETNIVVTGQPYFEVTKKILESNKLKVDLLERRSRYGIAENETVLLFAAEPIIESFEDPLHVGYNQKTILDELIPALVQASEEYKKKTVLCIKPHPRSNQALLDPYCGKYNEHFRVILCAATPQDSIIIADVVIGMSSMLLLEAALISKPIMSVQIGLCVPDPFVLSRTGKVKAIYHTNELADVIKKALTEASILSTETLPFVPDATLNVCKLIMRVVS